MFLTLRCLAIGLTCLVSLCCSAPADPTITPPPLLSKREARDNSDFIGYFASDNSWYAHVCGGTSYLETSVTASGWYGGCEYSSYYSAFTECYSDVAYGMYRYTSGAYSYFSTTSSTCTGYSSCISNTLQDYPGGAGTSYFIECASNTPRFLYRTSLDALPVLQSVTTTSTSSTSSSSSTSASSTVSSTISRETVSQTTSISPTPTLPPTPLHKKKSIVGPVTGGVIGGLAILALVAFLIWFFVRKHQVRNTAANDPSAYAQSQPVMVPQQSIYPPGAGNLAFPEKPVMAQASPVAPDSQREAWSPAMGGNPGISPPTSPPPTYFHQPQPQYPQQQSQQVSYQ